MSYTALEACAIAGLVLSIILAFVLADLSERMENMRQSVDSLKRKADEEEYKRRRAEREAEISPGGKTLGELYREADEEQERLENERLEKEAMAAAEKERQRMRSSFSWRLGRWFARRSKHVR